MHQFPVQLLNWSFIFDVILDLFLYLLIYNLTSLPHLHHLNLKPAGLLDQTEQVLRDIFTADLDKLIVFSLLNHLLALFLPDLLFNRGELQLRGLDSRGLRGRSLCERINFLTDL